MLTLLLALGGCARQAPQSSDGPTTSPTATALVVGATFPEELKVIRGIVGDMPLLIPGIGAQGGDVEATVRNGRCMMI